MKLPVKIKKHIMNMQNEQINIGCTNAHVFKFYDVKKTYYLKVDKPSEEFTREQQIYNWLNSKVIVPKEIEIEHFQGLDFFLMSEVKGNNLVEENIIKEPERIIKILAEGMKQLHSINISDCSFSSKLDDKLRLARYRLDHKLLDDEKMDNIYGFNDPEIIYQYLIDNKPEEDLVFVHGDYCLPNIIENGNDIGFIDMGRSGIGDRWQDIALCIRSLGFIGGDYEKKLCQLLNVEINYDKLKYYILLDELF